jgi:hypothetical protein
MAMAMAMGNGQWAMGNGQWAMSTKCMRDRALLIFSLGVVGFWIAEQKLQPPQLTLPYFVPN